MVGGESVLEVWRYHVTLEAMKREEARCGKKRKLLTLALYLSFKHRPSTYLPCFRSSLRGSKYLSSFSPCPCLDHSVWRGKTSWNVIYSTKSELITLGTVDFTGRDVATCFNCMCSHISLVEIGLFVVETYKRRHDLRFNLLLFGNISNLESVSQAL